MTDADVPENLESKNGTYEEPPDAEEIKSGEGWVESAHRKECLLFQKQGVRPALVEGGQRHWLYPALGVIRSVNN